MLASALAMGLAACNGPVGESEDEGEGYTAPSGDVAPQIGTGSPQPAGQGEPGGPTPSQTSRPTGVDNGQPQR